MRSPDILLLADHDIILQFWPYDEYWYQVLENIRQFFFMKLFCWDKGCALNKLVSVNSYVYLEDQLDILIIGHKYNFIIDKMGVVRISDRSGYFECAEEVANEMKVGGNEVKGIDIVQLVVTVVLEMLYDGNMRNKDSAKSKGGKEVEEGIEHRVTNPMSKRAEERKAEEEGQSF